MTVRCRVDLGRLAPYRPGPPAPPHAGPAFKLSSNENPYPPLPSVQEAIAAALGKVNRYPDMAASELTAALAGCSGVTPDEIVLGAGSVEVASAVIRAVAGAGDEVVYAWRSFEAYPQLVIGAGAVPVEIPLTAGLAHDLDAMASAVGPRTRCVIVCNPNNPTGTVVTETALERLLDQLPPDLAVVLDEAYCQFDVDPASPRGLALFGHHPNLVLLRTFSKAYGLAGLRVGYAVAPAVLAAEIRKVALPFGVTDLAQTAALASLAAEGELTDRVAVLTERRSRVEAALARQGWRLPASQGNFVWLPTGQATAAAQSALAQRGLVGRVFDGEGIRLTVGEEDSLPPLLDAAGAIWEFIENGPARPA
ncbi:MAG: histidinol-phosphate transaminase [Propionibacteriaceae bacterium]|jgi:histidinol-phosphate aminotransferase|nr:histidinol-phosphate transaminase [Propionibacteriaceae bacterium]